MLGDTGLEVVPGDGLLVADHYAGRDPEDVQGQSSNSHVSPDKSSLEVNAHTPKGRGMIIFKTRYIIGLVILTLATILGGVLGGVLGSRANFRSPSGGSTATGPNITLTNPPAGAPTIYNGTNLAAVGWLGAGNLEHHRVYYQSAINEICESAWDCSSRSWYILNHNLGVAKKGTPITAVFGTRPGGIIVNLYFLLESGKVQELVSLDGLTWEAGSLSTKNIIPAPSSKLAAARARNHYGLRESLLFVFQDDQNAFRLYNSTGNVWVDSKIPTNPTTASGVSLSQLKVGEYPDQLRLYYQTASGDLVAADWFSSAQVQAKNAGITDKLPGWNLNEDTPLSKFDMEAQVTSFAWGTNYDRIGVYGIATGFVGVLTSGSKGMSITNWFPSNTSTDESAYKPPVMALANYSAVASNFWRSAYAFNGSGIIEFTYTVDEDRETVEWSREDQLVAP